MNLTPLFYYANGQVQTYTGPDGATITYAYDGNGELSRVDIPGEGSMSVAERKWTEASKVVLPGGTVQEIERNGLLSPTRLRVKDPNQAIRFDQQSTYGKLEELTSRTTQGQRIDYSYDDAMRLKKAEAAGWGGSTESFDLDAAGNRLLDSAVQGTWTYDAANRLLNRGSVSYQYDAAGNQIKKVDVALAEPLRTTSYVYDGYNRLIDVRDGADQVVSRYAYNPFGYRVSKEVTTVGTANSGASAGKRLFMQAEEGVLAEVGADGAVLQSYGWQPDQPYSTSPLFLHKGAAYFYYQNDPLGLPRQLTDKAGSVVWEATKVSAFGNVIVAAGATLEQPWRFPGQYFDAETGLNYNALRFYDPVIGRYISSDPTGLLGGMNRYIYGQGAPTYLVDPYGLWADFPEAHGFWEHVGGSVYWLTDGWSPSQGAVNFWAGLGDGASFGVTNHIRDWMGTNGVVDKCSGIYRGADIAGGIIGGAALGGSLAAGRAARLSYNANLSGALASGEIQTAREAWAFRRALGAAEKAKTPFPFRWYIYLRNLHKYGNKLGPAYDEAKMAGKTIEQILKGTSKNFNMYKELPPGLGYGGGGIGWGAISV